MKQEMTHMMNFIQDMYRLHITIRRRDKGFMRAADKTEKGSEKHTGVWIKVCNLSTFFSSLHQLFSEKRKKTLDITLTTWYKGYVGWLNR